VGHICPAGHERVVVNPLFRDSRELLCEVANMKRGRFLVASKQEMAAVTPEGMDFMTGTTSRHRSVAYPFKVQCLLISSSTSLVARAGSNEYD
jgi:hypothetical protein